MRTSVRIVVSCALALCLGPGAAIRAAELEGRPAPALVGTDLAGRALDLTALRGRVVVLALWATWCSGCRDEIKMLDALATSYGQEGLAVIGLSVDGRHERGTVNRVAAGLSFPIAMLADAERSGFTPPAALPQTLVIDREGVVRAVLGGAHAPLSRESLVALIEALLRPSGPASPAYEPQRTPRGGNGTGPAGRSGG